MPKKQIQSFAKIPNQYVTIERNRGLSLLEEKLIYMLINAMQKRWESTRKLEHIDYYFIASDVISFEDFTSTMQIATRNRKEITAAVKSLVSFTLGVLTSKQDSFMTMFSKFIVDYETSTIKYEFNHYFVECFTGICRDYFKLGIEEVIGLNSTHAIRIYQMLKTKQNMDKKEFEYSVTEIKQLLNIDKKYSLYSNLKQFVLELSKSQINSSEASQFHIDYEEIKTGKAVTSIRFHILPKGTNYYQENNQLPNYQLELIKKSCLKWKKEHTEFDIVYLLADKILQELKHKNPLRALIMNALDTINKHVTKKLKL